MAIEGVSIAFGDTWSGTVPTWTQLDYQSTHYQVQSWQIDRGRQSELDKTSTGQATINIIDWSGDFDPTYSSGAFYGNMNPMKQVAIALENPTDSTWTTLFRGFVNRWRWRPDPTEKFLYVTIECVDGLEVLANAELMTSTHGTVVPVGSEGEIYYAEPGSGTIVQQRFTSILNDAGWPTSWRSIFTGNVYPKPAIYAPREQFLTAIDDAADSEFPGVSNRYIAKDGTFTFHGRLARFNPSDVQYDITTWKAGDDAAVASDSNRVPIMAPDFEFVRDVEDIVNACYSAPKDVADASIAGQWVTDATSISKYGYRSLSFENLLTDQGLLTGNNDLDETKTFAQYYVDNKKNPRTRIPQITFKSVDKGDRRASKTWALLCGIEITDLIDLSTSHHWGGGFAENFYVEGLHYDVVPGSDRQPNVTLAVDLSPQAFYGTAEW